MSAKFEKLKTLLRELFQLDQPDLDFGLYRILHARAAEVTRFLDQDLLPQVRQAFGVYQSADKAELEKELAKLVAGIQAAGMDPEQSPKVRELRARLAAEAVDVAALEAEVYDHLFTFFRRYYSEGDFLAKRVYKPGVYAIPYEGEEVALHWANKDQYYIKTGEYLRDYAFRLRPHDERNPRRVHFRLTDAAEGEHGNVKAAEGKERVFLLAPGVCMAEEDGELVIRFEYRPATAMDAGDPSSESRVHAEALPSFSEAAPGETAALSVAPNAARPSSLPLPAEGGTLAAESAESAGVPRSRGSSSELQRGEPGETAALSVAPNAARLSSLPLPPEGGTLAAESAEGAGVPRSRGSSSELQRGKPPKQKDLIAQAVQRVLANREPALQEWVRDLAQPHVTATGEKADYTRLEAHLRRYTARNTFDYFIHKDLGGFLRRELDFFIKTEVMHLDDVESETAPRVEQYLSKIKVIRRIAGKVIDFLAQLENFQKKLWLKKKFVVETRRLVRLDLVPDAFLPEICANAAQREAWVRLHAIDTVAGDLAKTAYSAPLTPAFLREHPSLLVDTGLFPPAFSDRLVQELGDLEGKTDGVLFNGDCLHAGFLALSKYRDSASAVYLDPPYNTGSDGFPYKDAYQHSSWMSMIFDRMRVAREFLHKEAACFVSIDENEIRNLHGLAGDVFGSSNIVADMIWQGSSKNDQRYISVSHEYVLTVLKDKAYLDEKGKRWLERKEGLDEIYASFAKIQREFPGDYGAQEAALKEWYSGLKPSNPAKMQAHYSRVEKRGIYFPDNISKPAKGYYYDVDHPVTRKPCAKPKGGWRFIKETMDDELAQDNIHFGVDETTVPCRKSFLHETEYMSPRSVVYQDGRAATGVVKDLLGSKDLFANPKDHVVLSRLFKFAEPIPGLIVDAFGGSGSTAHAAISLNRLDGLLASFACLK